MEAGIQLVVRAMVARYGDDAGATAERRARVLEACGDREASSHWDAVREQIEAFERSTRQGRRHFTDADADAVADARRAAFGDGTHELPTEPDRHGEPSDDDEAKSD